MAKNSQKGKPHPKTPAKKAISTTTGTRTGKTTTPADYTQWVVAACVLLITLILFLPTLSLKFVNWDDPQNILENEALKIFAYQWDWKAVKTIFTTDVIGNYNPLPIFTFAIEKYFFAHDPAQNPFIFHFNNLWMHLVCTLLVYILFLQLEIGLIPAALAALLFGIHPMRVESVAWITERKDVLYSMFFLGALCAYLRYLKSTTGKTKWYILAIVLSIISLFAKVQAVTLPLTMVALDFYLNRRWLSLKILIVEKLPWWILSLAFGLINIYFLKGEKSLNFENATINYTLIDRLAVGAYSYAVYIIKWLIPFQLSPLYPYPPKLPVMAYVCLGIVPIALIGFLVWAFKKKQTNLLFGWAFFTFNVMFLLQIVGAGQGFLADRFTYIAYIGLFFIFIKGYEWAIVQRPAFKLYIQGAVVLYCVFLAVICYRQISVWQNGGTLWEHVKKIYPNSPLAWKQAAVYYRDEEKNFDKSVLNFNEAIRLQPTDAYVYNGLAKVYLDKVNATSAQDATLGNQRNELLQLALQSYLTAIKNDSIAGQKDKKITGEMIVNLGVAYAMAGNLEKAQYYLTKGLEAYPENANGYLNRGLIYYMTGQYELCLKEHISYFRLNPYNADVYHEEGLCNIALGRYQEALKAFDKAISLKNTQPMYYIGRANAYRNLGNKDAALRDARQAQQMGAQVPPEYLQ
ncbi:MAG: tetratricopeptide repeat protein [Chitinophagales bacterium]